MICPCPARHSSVSRICSIDAHISLSEGGTSVLAVGMRVLCQESSIVSLLRGAADKRSQSSLQWQQGWIPPRSHHFPIKPFSSFCPLCSFTTWVSDVLKQPSLSHPVLLSPFLRCINNVCLFSCTWKGEAERCTNFWLTPQWPAMRAEPNYIPGSRVDGGDPNTWTIICCIPGCKGRDLNQKWTPTEPTRGAAKHNAHPFPLLLFS